MPDGRRYDALDPETYYSGARTLRRAGASTCRRHLRQAAVPNARRNRSTWSPSTWYRALRRQRPVMPDTYADFVGVLRPDGWNEIIVAHKTAQYGVGYCHQGIPVPQGGAHRWSGMPSAPVFNPIAAFLTHRRHAAAGPGGCWSLPWSDSKEKGLSRSSPRLWRRGPVNWLWDRLPMAVRVQQVCAVGLCPAPDAPARPSSTPRSSSWSGTGIRKVTLDDVAAAPGSAAPPSTRGFANRARVGPARSSNARTWRCSPISPPSKGRQSSHVPVDITTSRRSPCRSCGSAGTGCSISWSSRIRRSPRSCCSGHYGAAVERMAAALRVHLPRGFSPKRIGAPAVNDMADHHPATMRPWHCCCPACSRCRPSRRTARAFATRQLFLPRACLRRLRAPSRPEMFWWVT